VLLSPETANRPLRGEEAKIEESDFAPSANLVQVAE
jgi:hypothetical protein